MNQADSATRKHCVPLRTFVFVIALVALIMGAGDRSSVALAQSSPAPPSDQPASRPDMQGRAEAPIGHRQPRPQDLPRGLSHEEGFRTRNQEALDKKLEICRGC
jgi:hypothetical protein